MVGADGTEAAEQERDALKAAITVNRAVRVLKEGTPELSASISPSSSASASISPVGLTESIGKCLPVCERTDLTSVSIDTEVEFGQPHPEKVYQWIHLTSSDDAAWATITTNVEFARENLPGTPSLSRFPRSSARCAVRH
jgi:hypothetical protein